MPAAARLVEPIVGPISGRIAEERGRAAFQRDRDFIARMRPLSRITEYFSPAVRGLDNLPETGPVLVVANHSCLYYMPDAWVVGNAITDRRGLDLPAYCLVYDLLLAVPGYGRFLRRLGAIPASNAEADDALRQGAAVVVFPGGDKEACRSWRRRNAVDLAGRKGFIRLALRHGVPVVPVVSHGAHHAVVVASRGDSVARSLGLTGLQIHVFPFVLGPPFGINPLLAPPMPAKVLVEFLPALDWSSYGAAAADDPHVLDHLYGEITGLMQSTMDRLVEEMPHPVVSGSFELAQRTAGASVRVATAPFRRLTRS